MEVLSWSHGRAPDTLIGAKLPKTWIWKRAPEDRQFVLSRKQCFNAIFYVFVLTTYMIYVHGENFSKTWMMRRAANFSWLPWAIWTRGP